MQYLLSAASWHRLSSSLALPTGAVEDDDVVNERDPDRVDWLDLGPDPDLETRPQGPGRWRWWCLLVTVMVAAALLLTRNQHATQPLAGTGGPAASSSTARSGSALAARPLPEFHSQPPHTG